MKKQILTFAIALLSVGAMAQNPFDVQKVNVTKSSPHSKTATARNVTISGKPTPGTSYNGIVTRSTNANDPLYYKVVNDAAGEVSVSGAVRSNNLRGRIVIPEKITFKGKTYRVVRIDKNAFDGCNAITQVEVMGNAMVAVHSSAFRNCTSLIGVTLNAKCLAMAKNIFEGCTKQITLTTSANLDSSYFTNAKVIVRKR